MRPGKDPFAWFGLEDWFDALLPDFVLAFTFFTALIYAVLSRQFERQRSAAAMAASLGLALSIGLTWWEYEHGWSVRDLGPLAIGFAVLMLGMVMYLGLKATGGKWAGAGMALGASLLVAWLMGLDWIVSPEILQTVTSTALLFGFLAFLMHWRSHGGQGIWAGSTTSEPAQIRHDMSDLERTSGVSHALERGLRRAQQRTSRERGPRENSADAMRQLQRMLPAEGWLTERMARLRANAHRARKGHVARIEELQASLQKLSPPDRKRASDELKLRYAELGFDARLERLDRAVAETELRIRDLTRSAQAALAKHDHRHLLDILNDAQRMQKHNTKLMKLIRAGERKLQQVGLAATKMDQGGKAQ